VAALGVREIIICGHSRCGAMKALLHPEQVAGLPSVAGWLRHAEAARLIVKDHYPDLDEETEHLMAIKENVLVQLENLRTHPVVATRLARRELHLHGWVYEIESGQVWSYNHGLDQFTPLGEAAEGAHV
jgi:carbonic anhydrase